MITRLKTVNFKALHNTDIRFCDFTVLIGNNASGKSSVIQAIDFLITSCKAEFSAWKPLISCLSYRKPLAIR